MSKDCPQCGKSNEGKALVCICGHCFVEEIETQQSIEILQIRRKTRNGRLRKVSIFAGVVIFPAIGAAYWTGFIGSTEKPATVQSVRPLVSSVTNAANQDVRANATAVRGDIPYTVTAVFTGDTIGFSDKNNLEHKIRIFGISAPKLNELFGKESKENLSNLVLGKPVLILSRKTDENGLMVANVLRNGTIVGVEQLRAGLAHVIEDDSTEQTKDERDLYTKAEATAKNGKFGVWSGLQPDTSAKSEIAGSPGLNSPAVGIRSLKGSESNPPAMTRPETVRPNSDPPNSSPERVVDSPPKVAPSVPVASRPSSMINTPTTNTDTRPTAAAVVTKTESQVRKYILGPRGGCYFLNSKGNKSYVDHSLCN